MILVLVTHVLVVVEVVFAQLVATVVECVLVIVKLGDSKQVLGFA